MAISLGNDNEGEGLGPNFPTNQSARNPYQGFRFPAPFDPRTGAKVPLSNAPPLVQRLTIVAVHNDYLECKAVDDGETVYVAKSYLLRRTPFDGKTHNSITYTYSSAIQRSATDGDDTETQLVIPVYVVDDEIIGLGVHEGTGVFLNGDELLVQDANADGRAWAKEA